MNAKKQMKTIKYIGYYHINDESDRTGSLAAINKMSYVAQAIGAEGTQVEIISPAINTAFDSVASPASKTEISDKISLIQCPKYHFNCVFTRKIAVFRSQCWLFWYLFINCAKRETVLVYHSLALMRILSILKCIKGIRLILETNEIYSDVGICSPHQRKKEFNFIEHADGYLFPTELLNKKLNIEKKPYVINYGTYDVQAKRDGQFNDGKIHCVYAGTLDPRKGGATAAAAAAYLDGRYHIHILGFGSETEKEALLALISDISMQTKCILTYDGILTGEAYLRFLQSCQIGLSTQSPSAAFNDTSFPSKVLSYLSNGLRVVSIQIPALTESAIGNLLYFYKEDKPQDIATAIQLVDLEDCSKDGVACLHKLDQEFRQQIKKILGV